MDYETACYKIDIICDTKNIDEFKKSLIDQRFRQIPKKGLILRMFEHHWIDGLNLLIENGIELREIVSGYSNFHMLNFVNSFGKRSRYTLEDKIKFLDRLSELGFRFDTGNRMDYDVLKSFTEDEENFPIVDKLLKMGADPEFRPKEDPCNVIVACIYDDLHEAIKYFFYKGYHIPSREELRDDFEFVIRKARISTFELIEKLKCCKK